MCCDRCCWLLLRLSSSSGFENKISARDDATFQVAIHGSGFNLYEEQFPRDYRGEYPSAGVHDNRTSRPSPIATQSRIRILVGRKLN